MLKQGNLLWRRMNLALVPAVQPDQGPLVPGVTNVDTGLREEDYSREAGDPPVGGTALVGSRVQVLPTAGPTAFGVAWGSITIGEPFIDGTTHTVHVVFTTQNTTQPDVNCFFFDPHSRIGPGLATAYNPA